MSEINDNISSNETYEQEFSASKPNTAPIPIQYDNSTSIGSISSILKDQLPSTTSVVSNWAPSSFGSITTIDQFFINPKRSSSSSINWLGMASGSSIYSPDPVVQGANLKEKVKKACVDLETYIRQLYNDSSLGLYHMSEHIRKRVPQIVDEKVEITIEDMKDSCEMVESMPKIPCFNNINEMLKSTLAIVEAAKIKEKKT
ncbi:1713_t:CDS:2 [Funneliformis mosseae]|uniref:1713_t:CDS:1 n=1 Tax=Funneliformis mosseae TaxID=27381 RepID=A0A9N9EBS2_FUNMO|nr:1713_t:CDS:2 [Funneliformis mosseae]